MGAKVWILAGLILGMKLSSNRLGLQGLAAPGEGDFGGKRRIDFSRRSGKMPGNPNENFVP